METDQSPQLSSLGICLPLTKSSGCSKDRLKWKTPHLDFLAELLVLLCNLGPQEEGGGREDEDEVGMGVGEGEVGGGRGRERGMRGRERVCASE